MYAIGDSAPNVTVVMAAYRSGETIGKAIRSALAEPEVVEVIVVDDCSPDRTAEAARAADDGSGRLKILVQPTNSGPAAARNRAFAVASADYVAILDADDYFLAGRFARLFRLADWDVAADNVLFVTLTTDPRLVLPRATSGTHRSLGLAEFVHKNISRVGRKRGELGFLKPVFRRTFLVEQRLVYDECLRLGEDFAFYVRALLAGARFRITSGCGYVALERPGSLSGRHRTEDLAALLQSDTALLATIARSSPAFRPLRRHCNHIAARHSYRAFLDLRQSIGIAAALRAHALRPLPLLRILRSYIVDKLVGLGSRRHRKGSEEESRLQVRFLMES